VARRAELEIRNLNELADPCDGRLEAVVRTAVKTGWGVFGKTQQKETVLPLRTMAIRSEQPMSLFVDGEEMTSTRFDIGVEPMALKVITGKSRCFNS
jgi:diacylglycerol kinase family enzyme